MTLKINHQTNNREYHRLFEVPGLSLHLDHDKTENALVCIIETQKGEKAIIGHNATQITSDFSTDTLQLIMAFCENAMNDIYNLKFHVIEGLS